MSNISHYVLRATQICFYVDRFLVCQGEAEDAAAILLLNGSVLLTTNQKQDGDDEIVPGPLARSLRIGLAAAVLQDAPSGSGIFFKSYILGALQPFQATEDSAAERRRSGRTEMDTVPEAMATGLTDPLWTLEEIFRTAAIGKQPLTG